MNDAITVRLIACGLSASLLFCLGGIAIIAVLGHDGQLASNALTAFITIAGGCVGSLGGILINPKNGNNGNGPGGNPATVVVRPPLDKPVDATRP